MINVSPNALQAAGRNLMVSGRLPVQAGYGRLIAGRGLGGIASDAKDAAVDLGATYMNSQGDVTSLFGPAINMIGNFSAQLPPPYGQIAAVTAWGAGKGTQAVQGYLADSARTIGRRLAVKESQKALATMKESILSYWTAAAKDKMVQEANSSALMKLAVAGWNLVQSGGNQLDLNQRSRLVDKVYDLCRSVGAETWEAGMVAYEIASASWGTQGGSAETYAKLVTAGTPSSDPAMAWLWHVQKSQKKYDLSQIAQAMASEPTSDGAGLGMLAAGAVILAALAK